MMVLSNIDTLFKEVQIVNLVLEVVALLVVVVIVVLVILKKTGLNFRYLFSKQESNSSISYDIIDGKIIGTDKDDIRLTTFDDIVGLTEVKDKIRSFTNVFNNRDYYIKNGVDVPRGFLLYGEPGCGKTCLAKAIAYEANVNFICRNAADLVGSTNSVNKVSSLFAYARKHRPCIIFIDELDMLGARYGMSSQHQVEVTQLLSELDGMKNNDGILVIGATNNKSELDSALLRSGRLAKKFYIPRPNKKEDILALVKMYKGNIEFGDDLTDEKIARSLRGLSPADIKEILNEVGITALTEKRPLRIMDLENVKVELFSESIIVENEFDKSIYAVRAWHEVGHAIVGAAVNKWISEISIKGTNAGLGGFTASLEDIFDDMDDNDISNPFNEDYLLVSTGNRDIIIEDIAYAYGGYIGELFYLKNDLNRVTFGCTDDIKKATSYANVLVNTRFNDTDSELKYDLSEIGIGATSVSKSDFLLSNPQFKDEVVAVLQEGYDLAKDIFYSNIDVAKELVDKVLEEEIVVYSEIQNVLFEVRLGWLNKRQENNSDKTE